jgi:hypothetical protein
MLLNSQQRTKIYNFGLYGDSGSGKTSLAATAPDPVFLLSERQGFESVRSACERMKRPLPPVFLISTRDDLARAVKALQSAKPIEELCATFGSRDDAKQFAYAVPKTVVLDSLTDMMQMIWDHMIEVAPPKNAKDGLPDMMRYWVPMKERGLNVIRMFRDLPFHTVYLCLKEDKEIGEGDDKQRVIQPMMPMRGMASMLSAACNAVGMVRIQRVHAKEKEMDLRRWVQFAAPDNTLVKPLRPLADKEGVNMTAWIAKLDGDGEPTKTRTKKTTTTTDANENGGDDV